MAAIYNKFSDEYDKLYRENIMQFQKNAKEQHSKISTFVDFYPTFGIKLKERCEFLFYGRAVNG